MSTKPKKTSSPIEGTVGETLKNRRIARGWSLKDVELATRIRGKYLLAIESDDYAELPHDVYTRGFVQSYASYLDLDQKEITAHYNQQRGRQNTQIKRSGSIQARRFTLTPRLLVGGGGALAAMAVGAYLIWQFSALTAAPRLSVDNPSRDQVLYGSLITISGSVAGGADVFVNESPILVDGEGRFRDSIALQDGVNSISVTAKNRLGKRTTVTRNILAHVPNTEPDALLPNAPFDGVAISVQVRDSAATVTIVIDGKEAFRGTMLAGTTQTFKGTDSVTISTTNGGATHLKVTNSTGANQEIGALGKSGQAKNDFRFEKDTRFQ